MNWSDLDGIWVPPLTVRQARKLPPSRAYGIWCGVGVTERPRTRRHLGTVRRMLGMEITVTDRCDRDADATGTP